MPRFVPIPTEAARFYQSGGLDANGQPPERTLCGAEGYPCRHCLRHIQIGADMLILAYRPFDSIQPYAELGPIFLCADACPAATDGTMPQILSSPDYILRGYSASDRIIYGSGAVTPTDRIAARAEELFSDPQIAYIHVRSARNNCYQCRIDRD